MLFYTVELLQLNNCFATVFAATCMVGIYLTDCMYNYNIFVLFISFYPIVHMQSTKMNRWTPMLMLTFVCITAAQIGCDSPLRYRRPHLFRHCGCRVGQWTAWSYKDEKDCTTEVCQGECQHSGYANVLERRREATPVGCDPGKHLYETKEVCEFIFLQLPSNSDSYPTWLTYVYAEML